MKPKKQQKQKVNSPLQLIETKKIHFIGVGGIGMSALARYCHIQGLGSLISGSDKENTTTIHDLKNEGLKNIWTPHSKENILKANPDIVVYSTAINPKNEELLWAKENKKDILHRSDLLEILTRNKKLISVSGTHGKTTTSAMITEALVANGFNPSAILGGLLVSKNTNVIIGNSDYFVIEADESDKSFLKGSPEIGVITNIEPDHLENYSGGFEEIKNSFVEFSKKTLSKRGLVVCLQDKNTLELIKNNFDLNNPKLLTYGICENKKLYSISAIFNSKTKQWDIFYKEDYLVSLELPTPGEHNILNALAVFGIGKLIGLSPEKIKIALENYKGVKRRFQVLSKNNKITVVDDYAHHPTEIGATIKAACKLNPKRLIVVIQPHQPTRVRDFWDSYIEAIKQFDFPIYLTDIYVARGEQIEGINIKKLTEKINKPNVNYLPGDINQISKQLEKVINTGDLILIMGAGDITNLGPMLLKPYESLVPNSGNN